MTGPLFEPIVVGDLTLRNRVVKAAAFEGMSSGGVPSPALVAHHERVAAGGAAMTTVAFVSVTQGGRTFSHQMWMHEGVVAGLRKLTDAVHREGAAANIQLGHGGYMADPRITGEAALAPSVVPNTYGLVVPQAMTRADIQRLVTSFGDATALARRSGFDAVEIHAGHGYLINQFLSPYTNRRADMYGGTVEGRSLLLREVLERVRDNAGRMAVTVKLNLRDGFDGGLELPDAIAVAQLAERIGVDLLQLSGGFGSKTPWYALRGDVPYREIAAGEARPHFKLGILAFGRLLVPRVPFEEAYFFDMAKEVRQAVTLPLALVGGLRRRKTMEAVLASGIELTAAARPFIRDPDFVKSLARAPDAASPCVPCNRCVAAMYRAEQRCPYST